MQLLQEQRAFAKAAAPQKGLGMLERFRLLSTRK
jgi:hypothetical protein